MQMADRRYDRNTGIITIPDLPDTHWVAGVVVVLYDGEKYTPVFRAESLEHLPIPEIQEELGSLIAYSWEIANTPGIIEEEN